MGKSFKPVFRDDLSIQFAVPVEGAIIEVLVEPRVKRDQIDEEALFLILSYEKVDDLNMGGIGGELDSAHHEARNLLKSLITDSCRLSLKEGATK